MNQTIRKIMLDADGVLNRLIMLALELNGCPVSRNDDHLWPLPGNYDIVAACNHLLRGQWPVDHAEFWLMVTRKDWASTPKSDECDWLVRASCDLVGCRNVAILTKAIDDDSAAGKRQWVRRFVPELQSRTYICGDNKHFLAGPDVLLIDDSDANCEAFVAAGGQALLVPRPWNSRHAEDTAEVLVNYFSRRNVQPQIAANLQHRGLVPRNAFLASALAS